MTQEIYHPPNVRNLGTKFLTKEPIASSYLAYWPTTYREMIQEVQTNLPLIADLQVENAYLNNYFIIQ